MNEYLSKEKKMHEVSLPAIVKRYFSDQAFLLRGARGCQSSVHFTVKKETEREVLSTQPWSAALKLSQLHLASLTKNKILFLLLRKQWERRDTEKGKVVPIEY